MIHIGTSGYSYKDWVGQFYPEGMPERDWLEFYSREFDTCELNFTYYRMPEAAMLARMAGKTPDGFLFSVKAFQGLTHDRQNTLQGFKDFTAALQPLAEQSRLGAVLAQFPFSFHPTRENKEYLIRLREGMGNLNTVVEFRNAGWLNDDTFDLLEEVGLGFCCVDEPRLKGLLPPIARATGPVAYVRFHGRNAAKWWQHKEAWERYDYAYKAEELAEWTPKIQELDQKAPEVYVYTNNHYRGQAAQTARDLKKMLEL